MRFCKQCRLLDLETKPHTWWRRTHQVPGVVCCPDHGIALSVSQFVDGESWKLDYPLADDAQEIAKTPKPDELDHFVASGVQWLLNNKVITLDVGARRDVFMERLTIKGLTRGGQLRRTFFLESFSAQRTAEAWKERNLMFDASHASAWPAQIAISKSNHHSPVMHLLLMKFLGLNVQEFIRHAIDSNRPRHPTNRISPDAELAQQLVVLWADTSKTIEGICRELSISRDSVLSLARNLKLKLPRAENKKKAHLIMIKRGELRLKWVDRMRIPEKERMRICRWLSRYDRPWLHKHFGYKAPRTFKVDWSARDQLLLKMVPYVIAKIRAQLPFRRITKKAIIELLPYSNSTQIRMHLLPLLAQEIKARNETINEFILRRVKTIRQVSPELAPWAVREQASVPWSCRTPAIMSAMGYRFVGERWLATPETADRAGYGLLANPKTN